MRLIRRPSQGSRNGSISVAMLVLLLATLAAGPASAIGPTDRAAASRPDARVGDDFEGPWTGNNVYNITGAQQTKKDETFNPVVGQTHWFYFSLQSDGTQFDKFVVSAPGPAVTNGWRLRYYLHECCEITSEVRAGTYRTQRLAHGEKASLLSVSVEFVGPGSGNVTRLMTITSVHAPYKKDSVKFGVKLVACGC